MHERANRFAFGTVVRLSGVHRRTLDVWGRSGFLKPSVRTASGTGNRRAYSFADILAARLARRLRARGLTLAIVGAVITHIQKHRALKDPPADARLVVIGKAFRVVCGEDELLEALRHKGSPDALVIDVGRTAEEIRRGLKEAA